MSTTAETLHAAAQQMEALGSFHFAEYFRKLLVRELENEGVV